MTRTARLVAPGLAMIAVSYGLARFGYGLFLPDLREASNLGAAALGLIGAGSYAGYCLAVVASLVLSARVGPRFMLVVTGAVAVAGMAMISLSPAAWVLAVGVLVAGSSSGLASPPMGEAVARAVPPDGQDRANALINCGTGVGVALAGPAALLVADGWRIAWAGFAAVGLGVLLWNAAAMPGRADKDSDGSEGQAPSLTLGWLFRRCSLRLFVVAAGVGLGSAAYWTFSRDLVVQAGGMGEFGATVFWAVIGVSGIAGGMAGDLVGGLGLARALRYSLGSMAAAIGLLAGAPGAPVAAYASAALFGSSYIALTGIVLVWAVSVFHERPSAGLGAAFLILAAGQALGSILAGTMAEATSPRAAFWFFVGITLVTALVRPRKTGTR